MDYYFLKLRRNRVQLFLKNNYKKILLIGLLALFYLFASKMLVIVAYDRDYLRNPDKVAQLEDGHKNYLNIVNEIEKPGGKRIFMSLSVEFLKRFYGKNTSFVKSYKKTDRIYLFLAFIGFHLLLSALGFDLKSCLIGNIALMFYLLFGFFKVYPIWRWSDIPNLMFLIMGLYFLVAKLKWAFVINLILMSFNRETSIILVLVLLITFFLDNEEKLKKFNFKDTKPGIMFILTVVLIYIGIQILLEKIICRSTLPWGGNGIIWTINYFAKSQFTITGYKYFFNWFNILIILSIINFHKKRNIIKASIFVMFLYVLSVYLLGGVFSEGSGLFMPVAPILLLGTMEELKRWKVI